MLESLSDQAFGEGVNVAKVLVSGATALGSVSAFGTGEVEFES